MVDLAYEEMRQDTREIVDHAASWGFFVYGNIVKKLGDTRLAARTADKVYEKILSQEGVNGRV